MQYIKNKTEKKKEKYVKKSLELDDMDLEAIAEDIKIGYSSGWLNNEEKHIYWELKKNIWYDGQKEALTQIEK